MKKSQINETLKQVADDLGLSHEQMSAAVDEVAVHKPMLDLFWSQLKEVAEESTNPDVVYMGSLGYLIGSVSTESGRRAVKGFLRQMLEQFDKGTI